MIDRTLTDDDHARVREVESILIPHRQFKAVVERLQHVLCVFRPNVTDRFGIVTGDFGNVTEDFGNVTGRNDRQVWRCA